MLAVTVTVALAMSAWVGAAPGGAAATHPDYITALVGSPQFAVYELTQDPHTGTIPPTGAPYQLVARQADGTSIRFPLDPTQQTLGFWSLSRTMLTAVDTTDHSTVDWWNLASRTSGSLTLPKPRYVSADPRGVLYLTGSGALMQLTTTGSSTVISHPFARRPLDMTGYANGVGVVISGSPGQARYLRFSQPHQVHVLKTGSHDVVHCHALSKKYAACTTYRTSRATKAALLSLHGAAPLFANSKKENFSDVGLIGASTLAWTRFVGTGGNGHGPVSKVATLTAGSNRRTIASQRVAFGLMITAYRQVLVMPATHHRLLATANGRTFTVVVKAPEH